MDAQPSHRALVSALFESFFGYEHKWALMRSMPEASLVLTGDGAVSRSLLVAFLVVRGLEALGHKLEVVADRSADDARRIAGARLVPQHIDLRVAVGRTDFAFAEVDGGNGTLAYDIDPVLGSRGGSAGSNVRALANTYTRQLPEFITLEKFRRGRVCVLASVNS